MTPFADEGTPTPYNTDGVLWVSSVRDFARSLGIVVDDNPIVQDDYLDNLDDEEDSLTGDTDD